MPRRLKRYHPEWKDTHYSPGRGSEMVSEGLCKNSCWEPDSKMHKKCVRSRHGHGACSKRFGAWCADRKKEIYLCWKEFKEGLPTPLIYKFPERDLETSQK